MDNVLKQVDVSSQRKGSNIMSVPDMFFGGFRRKYGELMASEYMASLINTVAKFKLVRLCLLHRCLSALFAHAYTHLHTDAQRHTHD